MLISCVVCVWSVSFPFSFINLKKEIGMKKSRSLILLAAGALLAVGMASAGPSMMNNISNASSKTNVNMNSGNDNTIQGGAGVLRTATYLQVAIAPAVVGAKHAKVCGKKFTGMGLRPIMVAHQPTLKSMTLLGISPPQLQKAFLNYTNDSAEGDYVNRRYLLRTVHGGGSGSISYSLVARTPARTS